MNAPAKQDTRRRILDAGSELIHRQGYHNTGIQEILNAAGVPKGSFYFYFKSKEEFGLALVEHFGQFWAATTSRILNDESLPHLARLRKLFRTFEEYFTEHQYSGGCPVGNLAQEMGDTSPALARHLAAAIDAMAGRVAACLEAAREAGELPPEADPKELAYFTVAAWQGALIRMKVVKNLEPLKLFDRMVFDRLLA